jgi:hypothetical protein
MAPRLFARLLNYSQSVELRIRLSPLQSSLNQGMLVELKTIVLGPTGYGEGETRTSQLDVLAPSKAPRHFRHWLCVQHHSSNNLLESPELADPNSIGATTPFPTPTTRAGEIGSTARVTSQGNNLGVCGRQGRIQLWIGLPAGSAHLSMRTGMELD